MSLGLKRHNLDLEILNTGNPKTLVVLDSSDYFEEPDRPLLEITLPGYSKYFLANVIARKINTFNSNTIGLTETLNSHNLVDLPDGVWKFKLKVCPYDKVYKVKYHLRTVTLEKNLGKVFDWFVLSDCDVERDVKLKQSVIDIFLAIESGKANAESGNVQRASELYQIANTLASNLLKKLSGGC